MAVIAVAAQKGGVGKTTTTLNLGVSLSQLGRRVLLVDVDPQASLTIYAGSVDPASLSTCLADVLVSQANQDQGIRITLHHILRRTLIGVDLASSNHNLLAAEVMIGAAISRESLLRDALAPVRDRYDYILLDCPGNLGLLTVNCLTAADWVLIPTQPEYLALQSLSQLFETIALTKQRLHPGLDVLGLILNMVDTRTLHSRQTITAIHEKFGQDIRVFRTMVQSRVRLKDASRQGESILTYDPSDSSAHAYRLLAKEIDSLLLADTPKQRAPMPPSISQEPPTVEHQQMDGPVALPNNSMPADDHPPSETDSVAGDDNSVTTSCPYVGLAENPTDHLREPSGDHRCFAAKPPETMSLQIQQQYCLAPRYRVCPRFCRQASDTIEGDTETDKSSNNGGGSGRRWFWFRHG